MVSLTLDRRAFSYYDVQAKEWRVSSGDYEILVGASSRDIRLAAQVQRKEEIRKGWRVDCDTIAGDIMDHPALAPVLSKLLQPLGLMSRPQNTDQKLGEATAVMQAAMFKNAPLRAIRNFAKGKVDNEMLKGIVAMLNCELEKFDARQV